MKREPGTADRARAQLAALAAVARLFEDAGIDYWLFGGWAVDLHAGEVTRPHDDVDVAVWHHDVASVADVLESSGWLHAPEEGEDGGTGYERGSVRLELTFLERDADGRVYTPLRDGSGWWADGTFGDDVVEALGTRSRVVALGALVESKSDRRDDPVDAEKDRDDVAVLRKAAGERPHQPR